MPGHLEKKTFFETRKKMWALVVKPLKNYFFGGFSYTEYVQIGKYLRVEICI